MSYLMLDLLSTQASEEELIQLKHPMVGGVILFSRNYSDRPQLISLIQMLRSVRPDLIIAVDHEGGRVQRFRDGFTYIPAMGDILPFASGDMELAKKWAVELGFLMAIELLACDIDLSFAPVLDLNRVSEVIGKRAFSSEPSEVIELAGSFIEGMHQAGMASVGKHFPGHGSVVADSHIAQPYDERSKKVIFEIDMQPFKHLIAKGQLQGVMPAHVIYPKVDPNPAGFSSYWLQEVLRGELNFNGVIFSDDLGMKGAGVVGGYKARAQAALDAGCNMILICNDAKGATEVLNELIWPESKPEYPGQLLKPEGKAVALGLENSERWQQAQALAMTFIKD
ncbi:beta-N-acetylhexosaminidase [Shewanella sp. D64]|uniref:beta-N-acetylhexosaminidase n=1 Tax=unclassified Shewanella TaxID=196818 RepID=UPI0022BA66F8|nr:MULTISPECIES: beta-N-acetylhexosaminidase [unclassified Shewanella]MEC4725682.1 beta-N-acetylhexosaminidase [Shewanella sp. D64]MEC4737711.1 beta-N-acetylhexosaminidase [Shewanella sp. E94]WBJ93516.1 beta-N-acetylhexosaminidase [Shewanella sp. MTB7]